MSYFFTALIICKDREPCLRIPLYFFRFFRQKRIKSHLPLNYSYYIAQSGWEINRSHQFKMDRAPTTDGQQTCFQNKVTKLSECHIPRKK